MGSSQASIKLRHQLESSRGKPRSGLEDAFRAVERMAEVMHPGGAYVFLKQRQVRGHDGHVEAFAQNTGWRPVARYKKPADIQHTIRREIALNIGDTGAPLLDDHPFVFQYEKVLLEWAANPKKRAFLISLRTRSPEIINADSRHLTPGLEREATRLFAECRTELGIDSRLEASMLQYSWNSKPGYEAYPNACKFWMVLVLMWMIDHKRR